MRVQLKDNLTTKQLRPEDRHKNYIEYLEICWARHYEAVISPEIIWYNLLCEVAQIVKSNPEEHRHLFTRSEGQENIIVITNTTIIPVKELLKALKPRVPTEIDMFIPTFSESTEDYKLAAMTAFAEMVSPYYYYFTASCGIPAIHVRGTEKDWQKLLQHWKNLSQIIKGYDNFFSATKQLISDIIKQFNSPKASFWKDMFYMKKCGSGSQMGADGWIKLLFIEPPELNFPTALARIEYKHINTGQTFEMKRGLIKSTRDKNVLVPEFDFTVSEIKEKK